MEETTTNRESSGTIDIRESIGVPALRDSRRRIIEWLRQKQENSPPEMEIPDAA